MRGVSLDKLARRFALSLLDVLVYNRVGAGHLIKHKKIITGTALLRQRGKNPSL